jgi:hypothetical protein
MLKEDEKKREVRVQYIFPASPLKEVNVQMEDTLVSINGNRIDSIEKAQKVISSLETGNIVNCSFLKPDKTPVTCLIVLSRRPDYALYNGTRISDKIESLYPYFGIILDKKSGGKKSLRIKDTKIDLILYPVMKVEKETFFHNMGVQPGDSIGILDDQYENLIRYIQVLHLPKGKSIKDLTNITDYIYSVKRYKYDENIL